VKSSDDAVAALLDNGRLGGTTSVIVTRDVRTLAKADAS
jgi:hypothetical protein